MNIVVKTLSCALCSVFFLSGCTSLISTATSGFAEDLASAILDSEDLDMVRDGAPAYLLLMDGLLAQAPDSVVLLSQSARLNSAYATAFVTEPNRAKALQEKSLNHAKKAVCLGLSDGCNLSSRPFRKYEQWLQSLDSRDVPLLYQLGTTWASWIQTNADDFEAIAELGRVKSIMTRVVELQESYDFGGAHLYLGVFETLFPPGMGGRPEVGRQHFEKALALSEGKHLLTKVMFAEQYARLIFDRELHDSLLGEVLASNPEAKGLTLMNIIARKQAQELLESADAYF
tara:strand:- start:1191 stop:2051 length:861 start_codon:yes stop_codon:yes gene_type:complete